MKIDDVKGKLVSVDYVAELFNVTNATIRHLILDKSIKAYKIGNIWRIDIDSCMEYLKSRTADDIKKEEERED